MGKTPDVHTVRETELGGYALDQRAELVAVFVYQEDLRADERVAMRPA